MNRPIQARPIVFLIISLFLMPGCNSIPPEPDSIGQDGNDFVEPWETAELPSTITGDWYNEGRIVLTSARDTLYIDGFRTDVVSTAKSGDAYRIIYQVASMYFAAYIKDITSNELKFTKAYGSAPSEAEAEALTVGGSWATYTARNPWLPASVPLGLDGRWHINDGALELVFNPGTVTLEQTVYTVDSVQNNYHLNRMLLKNGSAYKTIYYKEIADYQLEVLLVDGKADMQDKRGQVDGDWVTVGRWWDLLDEGRYSQGASWNYTYRLDSYFLEYYGSHTPLERYLRTDSLAGSLSVQVTSYNISGTTGTIGIQSTFAIAVAGGQNIHTQGSGSSMVTLLDSTWAETNIQRTVQYQLVLENDTLWYDTPDGKLLFSSRRLSQGTIVNARMYLYPIDLPAIKETDLTDILGSAFRRPINATHIGDISPNVTGQASNTAYSYFVPGGGFEEILYDPIDYRKMPGDADYHHKEIWLYCRLSSFTPGN